ALDPEPYADAGGPVRRSATSVPGLQICELLPHAAKVMNHLALIRGVNTENGDHGKGQVEMTTGRNRIPGTDYPHFGAVSANVLTPETFPLPGHILIQGGGNGSSQSAYLGPKYASVNLSDGKAPQYSERLASVTEDAENRRNQF